MLKHFWNITFRNLEKNAVLSSIYLGGLSVSMAASTLIFIWIHYQESFDRSDRNAGNIYRVYPKISVNGNNFTSAMAPPPLERLLKSEFPEVVAATRMYKYNNNAVSREENGKLIKAFNEEVYQADSSFFQVFGFKTLQGNSYTCLTKPSSVVITKSTAIKYFGESAFNSGAVLGQNLSLNIGGWKLLCKITAITEDVPANTHFHYKIILSDVTDAWTGSTVWVDNTYYTYILLRKGADPRALEDKLPLAVKPHIDPQLQANFGTTSDALKATGGFWEYKLQAIGDIHLYSDLERELEPGENPGNVRILLTAAIFLLIMACINYANLSTGNSIQRSKEIGVRKTLGSSRSRLMALILADMAVKTLISWLIAFVLILLLLQPFEALMHTTLPAEAIANPANWAIFAGLFFIVSLFGGIFPALYLSSFDVIKAIKGRITPGKMIMNLKNVLIVSQFVLFIGLVICTLLVKQQLYFLRSKSPGFNKENVLILNDPGVKLGGKPDAFLAELKKDANVLSANVCSDFPNSGNDNFPISVRYQSGADHLLANFSAGYDFLETFGIRLLQGRDFNRQMDNDTVTRVILNAAAVKELGLKDAVNAIVNTKYLNSLDIKTKRYEVIGVADNFNFKSLHKSIQPMAIFLGQWGQYIAIRIKGGDVTHTLQSIGSAWQAFVSGSPFEYHFLDDRIDNLYRTEAILSNILLVLTVLLILVAAAGLTGVMLLTVQQRTKEIGIRKTIGASKLDILFLFSKEYIKWIGISFIVTSPIAGYAMSRWLQSFSYRIAIEWWVFAVAGAIALLVALTTIFAQAFKIAAANPIQSLKAE